MKDSLGAGEEEGEEDGEVGWNKAGPLAGEAILRHRIRIRRARPGDITTDYNPLQLSSELPFWAILEA